MGEVVLTLLQALIFFTLGALWYGFNHPANPPAPMITQRLLDDCSKMLDARTEQMGQAVRGLDTCTAEVIFLNKQWWNK